MGFMKRIKISPFKKDVPKYYARKKSEFETEEDAFVDIANDNNIAESDLIQLQAKHSKKLWRWYPA